MSWYYADNNERRGPIEDAAFQTLVASGTIKPDTLVWREGLTDWVPYSQAGSASAPLSMANPGPAAIATTATAGVGTGAAACSQCGRLFSADDMVTYEGRYICAECKPLFFQKIKEGALVVGERNYAGFWIRFGAKFIDGIILNIVTRLFGMIIGVGEKANEVGPALIFMAVAIAIEASYNIYFIGKYGATPGKMACKLEVIRSDGAPLTYGRATGRYFADYLSKLTLFIGYIMAAFDEEKRALHDRICDTRVVRKQQ
jgi:uncharacterized RDD family membrane protein YckC